MKPPFAYYGGKTRIAPWIASLLPPHRIYIEPFAGSAAVLFAKPPALHEILNDLDGHVVHFYRVLRERCDDLELACRLTPYARDEHAAANPSEPGLDDVERARRWWVLVNQSYAKQGTGATGFSSSVRRGSNNARSVINRIGRFAGVVERLAQVTIENRDALAVIRKYSDVTAVIYADPPYLAETRSTLTAGRRMRDYAHDMAGETAHRELAEELAATPATVFLSGYHSALYDSLYAGWWTLERRVVRGTSNRGSRGDPHATEVIWTNREPSHQLFPAAIVGG